MSTVIPCPHDPFGLHPERECGCGAEGLNPDMQKQISFKRYINDDISGLPLSEMMKPGNVVFVPASSPDGNVEAVRKKLLDRSVVGLAKYGETTENSRHSRLYWLQHAQEEAMDLAIYLQRLIEEERKNENQQTTAAPT